MSLREQYFLFQDADIVFPATVALAVAFDNLVEAMSGKKQLRTAVATTDEAHTTHCLVFAPLINRYLNPDDLVAHPTP